MILLVIALLMSPDRTWAQEESPAPRFAPWGGQIHVAGAVVDGKGIQVGVVRARTLYTRELILLADLEPLINPGSRQNRVVLLPGVSFRVFGVERLIGNAPYRGYDIDLGFRAGPGISFSSRETQAEQDRRFELVVDPFARVTRVRSSGLAWMLEVGATRPAVRLGVWIKR